MMIMMVMMVMIVMMEDERTHNQGDLQAVVVISAAQIICQSVSASGYG